MTFLCDTNVISELVRPQPNPGVLTWSTQVSSIYLSVVTVEEIYYGLASKPNSRITEGINQLIENYCTILPITPGIAKRSGELRGYLRTQGKPRTQADMLIAATAQVNQLTIVTRNVRDFDDCDLQILNPFT